MRTAARGSFGNPGADGFELFAREGMREGYAHAHLRHFVRDFCLALKNAAAMFEADAYGGAGLNGVMLPLVADEYQAVGAMGLSHFKNLI